MAAKLERNKPEKVIGKSKLQTLLAAAKSARRTQSESAGVYGQKVKDAVERDNLHAGAFALFVKLERMDPVKLRGFLDHFDYYRDTMGLDDLAAKDMFAGQPADGGGDEDEDRREIEEARKRDAKKNGAGDKKPAAAKKGEGEKPPKGEKIPREKVTSGTPVDRKSFHDSLRAQQEQASEEAKNFAPGTTTSQ